MERGIVKCPKCGSIKQLTPESRRTEDMVWRRRICKSCHNSWITEEKVSKTATMPTEAHQFLDKVMRHAPKSSYKKKPEEPKFDTSALQKLPW